MNAAARCDESAQYEDWVMLLFNGPALERLYREQQ